MTQLTMLKPLFSYFMEGINLDLIAGNLNPREFAYIQQSELDKS